MSLPTLVKTYEVSPNNVGGVTSASYYIDAQRTMFAIKQALTGGDGNITTAPWLVSRSSDSVTADGSDNWGAYTNVVFNSAGIAHSWIVLKQPGTKGYEICIDCSNGTSANYFTMFWSPSGGFNAGAGGTDGTTTARPTASDEIAIFPFLSATQRWLGSLGAFNSKVHCVSSTDGDITTVWVMIATHCAFFLRLEVVPDGDWTDNVWIRFGYNGAGQNQFNFDKFASVVSGYPWQWTWAQESGVTFRLYPSFEAIGTTETALTYINSGIPDDKSGDYFMGPIGLWGDQSPYRGKRGNCTDIWWGQQNLNGSQYPDAGTLYQFVQIGDVILPWDSATVHQMS